MKSKLIALMLLAGGSVFAAPRVGFGIGVGVGPAYGVYAPPAVVAPAPVVPAPVYVAPAPAPVYPWVGVGYGWRTCYWAHPYARGHFYGGRVYVGHRR